MAKEALDIAEKLSLFSEHWSPKVVARLNDYDIKVVKLKGEFVRHTLEDTDELFLVVDGELTIQSRDGKVDLKPGQLFVVPKGVEHCSIQRRLAGAGGHGPQPRARRRPARRTPAGPGHRNHPAPHRVHHARPPYPHRPAPTTTTTRELAMGRPDPTGAGPHPRDPTALLTTTPTPTTRTRKPADRPNRPALRPAPWGRDKIISDQAARP